MPKTPSASARRQPTRHLPHRWSPRWPQRLEARQCDRLSKYHSVNARHNSSGVISGKRNSRISRDTERYGCRSTPTGSRRKPVCPKKTAGEESGDSKSDSESPIARPAALNGDLGRRRWAGRLGAEADRHPAPRGHRRALGYFQKRKRQSFTRKGLILMPSPAPLIIDAGLLPTTPGTNASSGWHRG